MTKSELARRIAREHAAVRQAVRDLLTELEHLRDEPGSAHPVGDLPAKLSDFRDHLRRHFDFEERGGFLDGSTVDAGTQRTLEGLVEQHRELERELAALLEGVMRAAEERTSLPEASIRGLRDFLADLGRHERAENDLVQKLVVHDVGAGD